MTHKQKNGKIRTVIAIVSIILILGGVLGGVVMSLAKAYFLLPADVAHHAKDFTEMKDDNDSDHNEFKADIDSCQAWMGETKAELVGIKKDIGTLGYKVDRNFEEQKALSNEILREIRK